jgi:16S rRNA (guanine527-N7)-methyltransferase
MQLFDSYRERIIEINKSVNITRITEKEDFDRRHYIDSLMCCLSDEFLSSHSVLDLGSGGGFPGVPLAIMFPEKEFVLMDSSAKRMRIVQEIADDLNITNVETIHGRAEEMGRKDDYREQFDLCVSRAVASMSTLSEYCLPFVKTGGCFIAYKGPGSDEEIEESDRAVRILGGKMLRIDETADTIFSVPGNEGHRLVYVSKENSTPSKYPRGGGKPSKKPL